MKKKTKFININVAFMNKSLSVTETALLSLIKGLSKKRGYCYASNKAICDTLNISDRTLYRMLSKLEAQGFLERDTKSTGGRFGKERKIRLSATANMTDYII
jgi:DNA-binding PadR family transcriptional regulator